jgi:hypothetical protein
MQKAFIHSVSINSVDCSFPTIPQDVESSASAQETCPVSSFLPLKCRLQRISFTTVLNYSAHACGKAASVQGTTTYRNHFGYCRVSIKHIQNKSGAMVCGNGHIIGSSAENPYLESSCSD